MAGFLTQLSLSCLPILMNSGLEQQGFYTSYTAAGTVPDFDRIPFYANERISLHHQNDTKVKLKFKSAKGRGKKKAFKRKKPLKRFLFWAEGKVKI